MKYAISFAALTMLLGLGAASTTSAQAAAPAPAREPGAASETGHTKGLLIKVVPPIATAALTVTTPAFKAGGDIPFENTQYRGNNFPGLSWTRGPAGTKSYIVAVQGALGGGDDLSRGTSIHFNLFNVPADISSLPAGLKAAPAGAMYGASLHGINQGYVGPHTHNFVKHGYHYQVLAIDKIVGTDPKTTLADLVKQVAGHVLASGEVIGFVAMDPDSDEGKAFIAKQAASAGAPLKN